MSDTRDAALLRPVMNRVRELVQRAQAGGSVGVEELEALASSVEPKFTGRVGQTGMGMVRRAIEALRDGRYQDALEAVGGEPEPPPIYVLVRRAVRAGKRGITPDTTHARQEVQAWLAKGEDVRRQAEEAGVDIPPSLSRLLLSQERSLKALDLVDAGRYDEALTVQEKAEAIARVNDDREDDSDQ